MATKPSEIKKLVALLDDELAICTRCESEVEADTLIFFGSWKLCDICVDDL